MVLGNSCRPESVEVSSPMFREYVIDPRLVLVLRRPILLLSSESGVFHLGKVCDDTTPSEVWAPFRLNLDLPSYRLKL